MAAAPETPASLLLKSNTSIKGLVTNNYAISLIPSFPILL